MTLQDRLIGVALSATLVLLATGPAAHSADITLDQIYSKWRARQDAVRSARFNWVETRTTPRGTHGAKNGNLYPANDTVYDVQMRLLLDGPMIRFDWQGNQWHDDEKRFIERAYVSGSDNKTSKRFYTNHFESTTREVYPMGFIRKERHNDDAIGNAHLELLILTYRPLDPVVGCTSDVLIRNNQASSPATLSMKRLDGTMYAVIERAFGSLKRDIWVDVERGCTIKRYVVSISGNPFYQIDATYRTDPHADWVPDTWRIEHWIPRGDNTNPLLFSARSRLESYAFNEKIDIDEFRPAFPEGTLVHDVRSGEEFIVKAGTVRYIMPDERRRQATHSELLATESGRAGLYGPDSSGVYSWIAILALIAAIMIVVWRIRVRSRAA